MKTIKGSCLCNTVQFEVVDSFLYAGYCHCSQCRKASGATGNAIGGIKEEMFKITKGESNIKEYEKSSKSISCHCNICCSIIYGKKLGTDLVHIRYGMLDDSPSVRPQAHMHVASKPDWYEILDGLPQFSEFPPM